MIVGEVIEIKKAFKPKQKDDLGFVLPLGSILVRVGTPTSNLGQLRNIYARPASFNRRIPLIGEHVILMQAPVNDETTDSIRGRGYIYFSPINATDDLTLHQFPYTFTRDQNKKAPSKGKIKHDRKEPGYTFPKKPKKTENVQPFEGDDIWEGRFGQSIRFGSTVVGDMSNYSKKPTWRGASNTDPIMILRVKKPDGGTTQAEEGRLDDKFQGKSKYVIEDIKDDDASLYIATTQMVNSFKAGFNKNLDVKLAGNWKGKSQMILNAERILLNATKDSAFLIGAKEAVVTGKRVLFQDDKYKVYLDELMDFLKEWLKQDQNLAAGSRQYATACGPTATATNLGDYIKLSTAEWTKFKLP